MNAAGLTFVLSGVVAALKHPSFEKLVADGKISQGEFHGTLANLDAVLTTLRKTPGPAVEKMVAEYNDELTEHLSKFNSEWTNDLVAAFRDAQTLAGYITTIMAKSGLTE
jgi:hypothetical protein